MPNSIKVILIDNENKNKYLEEIEIGKPKTLEELFLTLEKKMKNFPNFYNLFYILDDKEINIQNNDQYLLFSDNILFIRQADPKKKCWNNILKKL